MPDAICLSGWEEPALFAEVRAVLPHFVQAILLARTEAPFPETTEIQVRRMLNTAAWATTVPSEAHKYDQRYISSGAKKMFEEFNEAIALGRPWIYEGAREKWHGRRHPMDCVVHEHVHGRAQIIEELLSAGSRKADRVADVINRAVACVVTVEDHRAVSAFDRKAQGWDRYERAGVGVWDRKNGTWKLAPNADVG